MAPIIEVSNEDLNAFNQLGLKYKLRKDLENSSLKDSDQFIYVPSMRIYIAKERKLHDKNWFDAHKELQANGERMLTIPEFIEFLKYIKINSPDIYRDITEIRNPWRAEWLDADFKIKGKNLCINYNHILDSKGNLIPKNSEILNQNTLMKDKTPGISLENFLKLNHTKQGLPNKKVKSGDLYYWHPRSDNNSVARFDAYSDGAGLDCDRDPSYGDLGLGVRAVKHK